ncbi:MAG: sigma 54-interacting transcriptional regulator [Pseudohongiella sp.]|uniref:sigma 54-interacting transcriptional regulator n=1 Tax=Pseudohongiella sp. TaxID=1979412 RepID=UPI0034A07107
MTDKPRILLVDDDQDLLHLIRMRLQANGMDVNAVDSAQKAVSELGRYRPHVVITDLRMPGMDGMALFESIQARFLQLPVIILTAHGTIPDAVAAVQQGVFSYLVKPFDAAILLDKVRQALNQSSPQDEQDTEDGESWRQDIVSCSQSMEILLQQARAAARTDVSVLIQSETGTGKELLAKAIHRASNRREAAFMTLNCAAIPETLLESELFGHAAGAFTGAGKATDGLFKAADKGTVFLDEIGDMPLSAQAKLLRVLEQGEVRPVGSTETITVDVRILSATHHDLHEKVREGSFREDLFYRLNVITLEQPPLADRREDIPLLANHFAQQLSERHNRDGGVRFAPDAMELMVSAPWPGNVRQLLNVVEQCVVLSPQSLIPRQLVERALRFKPEKLLNMNDAREQFEHDYLIRLLNLAEGNIALAARLAERNRSEFYNLLRRHDLDPAQFRKTPE